MSSMNNKVVAVIRIRGTVGVRKSIAETLERLRLKKVNNCIVLRVNDSYAGMLKKCKDFVAYGELDENMLSRLLTKNGLEKYISEISEGKAQKELKEHMPIRLHPPRHGFKSTKKSFRSGGSLGYMGPAINALISRMI